MSPRFSIVLATLAVSLFSPVSVHPANRDGQSFFAAERVYNSSPRNSDQDDAPLLSRCFPRSPYASTKVPQWIA